MDPLVLPNLVQQQVLRLGERPALKAKRYGLYQEISWQAYGIAIAAVAGKLVALGVQAGDRVAIVSENRPEWAIANHAIACAAGVVVPMHAALAPKQIAGQLADSGARLAFVSSREQLQKLRSASPRLPVITFDPIDGEPSWRGAMQQGRLESAQTQPELEQRRQALRRDDLLALMYTSGTTGEPKGVMLTHGNILGNAQAFYTASPPGPEPVFLNWLPLSHIYAYTVDLYGSLSSGALLCFAESADTVLMNLAEVRPTHLSAVPRFYEKVLAYAQHPDPAITRRKLQALFAGRLEWLGCGGAPLPPAVALAYADAGLLVLQGYGLTESSPVIAFNRKDCYRLDSVGPPIPGIEVQVAADGELLTRGPHVMKGYWNAPDATAAAIEDGWLHTGDLARIDDGFITITGRKKDLLVLSSGKKVVPTYVESLLVADPVIDQALVCGEGHSYLAALIVPHWGQVIQALQLEPASEPARLASDPKVLAWLQARVDAALADVSAWEKVKKIALLEKPFSPAAGEMTVSLKLRRDVIRAHYAHALDALYQEQA